jgi:hypothetical protein
MNRNRLALIAALGVSALTSVADAAGLAKFKEWSAAGYGGPNLNPEVDGMAVLKHTDTPGGEIQLTISLHGLEANAQFSVMVVVDDQCIKNIVDGFVSSSRGDFIFHTAWDGGEAPDRNLAHVYEVFVYQWDGAVIYDELMDPEHLFPFVDDDVTPLEARAYSMTTVPATVQ